MYDSAILLASIDANYWPVLFGFGIAMVFQCWWLGNAVVTAKRDRAYSIPVFCTAYWFAHDLSVVLRFEKWFVEYNHWYLKLFWFGLLLALLLEVVFLSQIIKYGRQELMPNTSARRFSFIIFLTVFAGVAIHEFFKLYFGDPLYQLDPTLTMLVYPVFSAALLVRRGSTRGQSVTMWASFAAMTLVFHITTYLFFGQQFSTIPYLLAGILAACMGGVMCSKRLCTVLFNVSTSTEKLDNS